MQADHNQKGLSVKDHVSYTRTGSRGYVALDAATKEEWGLWLAGGNTFELIQRPQPDESEIRIRACLQACRKCRVMNAPLGAGFGRVNLTAGC